MRVGHVISSLEPQAGGPTAALIGLSTAQTRAGADVKILTTYKDQPSQAVVEVLTRAGVQVRCIGPARGRLGRHPDLADAVRQIVADSDILHIHALWEQIQHQSARTCRRARVPYIFRPCGMLDPWSLRQSYLSKRIYMAWRLRGDLNRAAALHFTTDLERDLVQPLHLRPPAIVEPNGLDLADFATLPPPGTFAAQHPELAGRPYILFMSRLHHKKGLDILIPAFARAHLGPTILVIAGPDSDGYRAQIDNLISQNGLAGRTLLMGMIAGAKKIAALSNAELFVLPSYQENFGIVVAEAMAAGTPVILSDGVNIHPQVTAAGAGATFALAAAPPQPVAQLAALLEKWMSDPPLRRQAGQRGRAWVFDHFDWQQIARHWIAHYQRLLARDGITRNKLE